MNIQRLKELLEIEFISLSTSEKREIQEYYSFVYDYKACTSCKDKTSTYYNKLKKDGLKTLENKSSEPIEVNEIIKSNFKLRTNLGVTRISFGNGQYISLDECEDEVALGFLEANPNRISMFETFPENWKELITKMKNTME